MKYPGTAGSADQNSIPCYLYKCLEKVILTNDFVNTLEIDLHCYSSSNRGQFGFEFEQMICHLFLFVCFFFFLTELEFWTVPHLKTAKSKPEVDRAGYKAFPFNFMEFMGRFPRIILCVWLLSSILWFRFYFFNRISEDKGSDHLLDQIGWTIANSLS